MRFMAMASVSCASLLIEPNDIAPVAKRFTISDAGSTSSSGTGGPAGLKSNMPRSICRSRFCWFDDLRELLETSRIFDCRTACCSLLTVVGFSRWRSPRTRYWYSPPTRSSVSDSLGGCMANSMLHQRFAGQHFDAHAFDARGGAGEISLDQRCSGRSPRKSARPDSFAAWKCPSSRRFSAGPCRWPSCSS